MLTRAGMRVRLDLSASGGSPSKWLTVKDITPRGGAQPPAASEPATAPAADPDPAASQPEVDGPEEGTPVKAEPKEQVTPVKAQAGVPEPSDEEPKEMAPWQKEARTPKTNKPKPSASPKASSKAETPALPAIGDLSSVPSDQKDSQLENDRGAAMGAIRAVAQAATDLAQDPFKAAVAALKQAATEDSKYKKASAGDKATSVIEVVLQYGRALRVAGLAQESPKVKSGVKTALKGKVDTVQTRFDKLKAEVPKEQLEQLEKRLADEASAAAGIDATSFDDQLSRAISNWEDQWEQAWAAVHVDEPTEPKKKQRKVHRRFRKKLVESLQRLPKPNENPKLSQIPSRSRSRSRSRRLIPKSLKSLRSQKRQTMLKWMTKRLIIRWIRAMLRPASLLTRQLLPPPADHHVRRSSCPR